MATKTLKSRIKMKRDTSANWTKNDPILLNGEIIIVDTEAGETRYKIGDGTKKYSQLPFQDEIIKGAINNKQDKITATGILKGDGNGNITAATANTDYLPVSNPVLKGNPTAPTPTTDTSIANKKYVDDALGNIVQVRTVSLPTSSWTENDGYYSQKFVFTGGSSNSKVDFQVDSTSYSILKASGTYLLQSVNESGLFYAYAYGGKPNADLSIQISFMGAQVI